MKLDLTREEAQFLDVQLARHAQELEHELIHTDKRSMQRSLAGDVERLRQVRVRLTKLLEAGRYDFV